MPNKKLYRSEDNKVFAGIIGGIGEYMDVDPTILRLVFIFLVMVTGIIPGVIAYFVAMLVVPKKPKEKVEKENKKENKKEEKDEEDKH
ncbi:MAG TPA: PspC domain-containing protein [Candidatus Paceibacterota bacterium]|nr:PspC domain-containing protein [Candidatus Paceibacterota bacterium]